MQRTDQQRMVRGSDLSSFPVSAGEGGFILVGTDTQKSGHLNGHLNGKILAEADIYVKINKSNCLDKMVSFSSKFKLPYM